jgi:hypothetical protein
MLLDLKFSIGTLGIGSGAFVAALYGMNLKNFIEDSELGLCLRAYEVEESTESQHVGRVRKEGTQLEACGRRLERGIGPRKEGAG